MNIEIKILLIFFLFAFCTKTQAQFSIQANPSVSNAELLYNSTAHVGEFSFEFGQGGKTERFNEKQPVKMTICFMNVKPVNGIKSVEGDQATYFEWTYIDDMNCLRGVQIKNIPESKPDKISILINAKNSEKLGEAKNIGFIANIQPAPQMNHTNKTDDDDVSKYQLSSLTQNFIIAENEKY